MGRSGDEAQLLILDAAERLFAERGVESVSLRDVATAAGQRNNSAIQYHFGDRAGLVVAVLARRMGSVNERRNLMIEELDRRAGADDEVHALVHALVVPLVDVVSETSGWYARFLVRIYWDVFAMTVVAGLPEAAPVRLLDTRLSAALADLDPALRRSRINQLMMLVITTLASWEWAHDRGERRLPVRVLTEEITLTGVALLTAPAPAPKRSSIGERFG